MKSNAAEIFGMKIIPHDDIPDDTIVFAVPAMPWEDSIMGFSVERSVIIRNVKVQDGE